LGVATKAQLPELELAKTQNFNIVSNFSYRLLLIVALEREKILQRCSSFSLLFRIESRA
jgi:hypothetical protein